MKADVGELERKRFPDGELYVRILTDLSGKDVLLVSDIRTSDGVVETSFLLEAARGMNPRSLRLFTPYFSYMRQHTRYKKGEPVSSKVLVDLYTKYADGMLTVEIHDEETLTFTAKPFANLKLGESLKDFYSAWNLDMVVSPDDGGFERATKLAELLGVRAVQLDKVRIDSSNVAIEVPDNIDFSGKKVLLIDDIISTGGTMIKAMELLRSRGVSNLGVCAVHGLFVNGSERRIASLADDLSVTNTVPGEYSKIDVSAEVATYLAGEYGE